MKYNPMDFSIFYLHVIIVLQSGLIDDFRDSGSTASFTSDHHWIEVLS